MARYRLKDGTIYKPIVIPKIRTSTTISLSDIAVRGDDILKNHLNGYISAIDAIYNVPYQRYNINTTVETMGEIYFDDICKLSFNTWKYRGGWELTVNYLNTQINNDAYNNNSSQPYLSVIPIIYGIVPIVAIAIDSDVVGEVTTAALFYLRCSNRSSTNRVYDLNVIRISDTNLINFFNNEKNVIEEPISQPVADDNGNFDNTSDVIELPDIGTINIMSALTTSAVSAYKMTSDSINSLMSLLWSEDFYNTLIKNQQSPIDNIQKLTCYPFDVLAVGESPVIIGNNVTTINGGVINAQFQEIDFGSVTITEYYGTALDYNGTDITIVLPFIGERQLSMPDIGSATISLKYRVDILTGNCVAIISAYRNRDNTELNSVIYQFSGNLANEFPLTQAVNKSLTKYQDAYYSLASGNVVGALSTAGREGINQILTGMPSMQYQRTGNLTASSGYMGVLTPYLIISRPVNIKPRGYDKYYGYPSFYTVKLSGCKGYTQIHELISDAPTEVPADDWEKIKQMLKDGIIIN